MESARYPVDALNLAPGQSLRLCTDGVTKAMNSRDEFCSEERLLATARQRAWDNPRVLVDTVHASIAEFAQKADQTDDITMLAVRYCGVVEKAPLTFSQAGKPGACGPESAIALANEDSYGCQTAVIWNAYRVGPAPVRS